MKVLGSLVEILKEPEKRVLEVPLNWATIVAAAAFWSYGYFGAISFVASETTSPVVIAIVSLGLYAVFLTLLFLAHYKKELYADSLTVRKSDIIAFCSLLVVMGCMSINELIAPLVGDQLAHSHEAQRHGIVAIQKLAVAQSALGTWSFALALYLFDIVSIGLIIGLYFALRRRHFVTKVIILSLIFWGYRVAIILAGGGNTPHPPLRTFPLWLSSSLLSSCDFSFRLPQFLGLVLGMCGVQRLTRSKLGAELSWLLALCTGTIPLLWHVGTMAEQSIWTAVPWTLFLLAVETQGDLAGFKWMRWVAILALAAMLRQSAFVAFIPLAIFYVVCAVGKDKFAGRKVALLLAPALLMFPFLVRSLVLGTPANYVPEMQEATHIPFHASTSCRVWYALRTGIVPWVALRSVLWPWIIVSVLAFVPQRGSVGRWKAPVLATFFGVAVAIFFGVRPVLWGTDRYQAEYIVPFAVLGFFRLLVLLRTTGHNLVRACVAGCVLLVAWNTFAFKNFSIFSHTGESYRGATLTSEAVYDYRTALKAAQNDGFAGHTFLAGVTYGVLPEIINGFTVAQVVKTRAIALQLCRIAETKNVPCAEIDPAAITDLPSIQLVLISDYARPRELVKAMGALGWVRWKDFTDTRSGNVIYGMVRSGRADLLQNNPSR